MIRPITLNVVGHVLSQGRASAPALDAGLLVRRYIEQSVEQPAIREIAPRVLKELVTEQGTKRPRSEKDLVEQTRLRPGEVRAVMNGLSAAALARPLDAAQGVWELSHDFVARAVSRYLGRRRLDWPGLARAFAAPALFVLMAAGTAGAVAWNITAADRAWKQLADLGIELQPLRGAGLVAESRGLEGKDLTKVVRLLGKLRGLRSLDLSRAKVADVSPLKDLSALGSLVLSDTKVADLAPLKGLIALGNLDLSGTQITDLTPLRGLTALEGLNLSGTQITDLAPLKDLTALVLLWLSNTRVTELAPLKGLTALQLLDLSNTWVTELAPLKGLTALQFLDLSNTEVTEPAPLKGLTPLETLNLHHTRVVDLAPLQDLPNLKDIIGAPEAELQKLNAYRSSKGLPLISD
jgi:Leucine-rich repeat (LRR) protein